MENRKSLITSKNCYKDETTQFSRRYKTPLNSDKRNKNRTKSGILNSKITQFKHYKSSTNLVRLKKKRLDLSNNKSTPIQKNEKNIFLRKSRHNKKSTDLASSREDDFLKKELLYLNDSLYVYLNNFNKDELLVHNNRKKNSKTIDNTLTNSILKDSDKELEKNENYTNLTFGEIIEINLDNIIKYLSKEDYLKIDLLNKECFKILIYYIKSKIEDKIDKINESIIILKNENKDIKSNENEIPPFECNIHSKRAITLLNSISMENIFKANLNNKYIILIFDILFIAFGEGNEIIKYKDNSRLKLEYYKEYFGECKNCGNLIESKLNGKKFNSEIIYLLYEFSYNYIKIINPNFYQKINSDITLLVFIVKDILEHVGILTREVSNQNNILKLYSLYNIVYTIYNNKLKKLNQISSLIK